MSIDHLKRLHNKRRREQVSEKASGEGRLGVVVGRAAAAECGSLGPHQPSSTSNIMGNSEQRSGGSRGFQQTTEAGEKATIVFLRLLMAL